MNRTDSAIDAVKCESGLPDENGGEEDADEGEGGVEECSEIAYIDEDMSDHDFQERCLDNSSNLIRLVESNVTRRVSRPTSDELRLRTNYPESQPKYNQQILIFGQKPYSCKDCSYKTSRKHDLRKHVLVHTGRKPFACHICAYKCSQKVHLQSHMLTHTGEKPFSCTECDYTCSLKAHLQRHMFIHTREKPFSCIECDYLCSQKAHLQSHMLTHTKEKPFSCDQCDYLCSQKPHLKSHMLTHAGTKPFSCEVCSYTSTQRKYLKRHVIQTHANIDEHV